MKIRDLKEDLLKQWKVMLREKYCGESTLNYYKHSECVDVLFLLNEEQKKYWTNIFSDSNSFKPDAMEDSIQKISIQPKNSSQRTKYCPAPKLLNEDTPALAAAFI